MSATDNKKLVQHYFDTMMGKARDKPIGDFFSEDVVWHVPQSNPSIVPNPRVGHAAVMDLLTSGVGIYQPDSMSMALHRLIADDEHVAAQFTLKATLANGKDYENQYFFLFAVHAGQITGIWEYLDTLYQWRQGAFD